MKYTKLLFLPALTLTLSMAANPVVGNKLFISTADIYGPFTSNEDSYFKFTSISLAKKITGTIKGYKNGNYVFSRGVTFTKGESGGVNISTKNRITTSGIRLDMYFEDDLGSSFETSVTIYPPLETTLTVNKQRVSYGGSIFGLDSNIIIGEETYDFKDTNEYYSLKTGNKIDISGINFEYSPLNKYRFSKAYLEILDNKIIYPNLKRTTDNYIRIPLKKGANTEEISFEFNTNMYVNYTTLEMSVFQMSGYEETDDFYLPLGKEDLLEDEISRIVIEGSGFNRNTIIIPLSFYQSSKLFGSCDESDYCVHGGIREWYCCF